MVSETALGVDLCAHAAALSDRQARSQTHRIQDLAITPVTEDEVATHEMFRTDAARAYVDQERRLEKARHGAAA